MKAIYKIARLELLNLFYSPVAWLILIAFIFITGSQFSRVMEVFAMRQELGNQSLYNISQSIFYPEMNKGLWERITELLYLFMPLLTMGLISQEFTRGSVKLLFSAPIDSRQIVLGKYLGIMIYGLLMMAVGLLYVVIAGCFVENFDWPAILSGLLGVYLLLGLYAAIGLFMSTLTTYPIVAAILMLGLLSLLGLVSGLWQEYTFVREITYWLSISGRADTFINGMICSEDLLYFVIITAMFLGFAILKLQLRREHRSFTGKAVRYLAIFAVAMLLGFLTSRPSTRLYYDATYVKSNTLTQASQEIVSQLEGKLKITTYNNLFGDIYTITPQGVKGDIARYNRYLRFKPEIRMDYLFYYQADTTTENFKRRFLNKTLREAAQDMAKMSDTRLGKYLTPEKIGAKIDLSEEYYRFVALIEREDGRKTFLRVYNDVFRLPFETEISAALKRLAMPLPWVGFISDHGTRSITGDKNRDYSFMVTEKSNRTALINQGFDVMDVSLREKQELDKLDILVVSDPVEPFTEEELEVLLKYLESGRNLVIAGKPKTASHLAPLMEYLGLQFEPGILVQQPIDDYPAHLLLCRVSPEAENLARLWGRIYHETNKKQWPSSIVMPGASAINVMSDKGFQITPLLYTRDSAVWNEMETIDFVNETAILDTRIGEQAGVKTTMMALEREQRGHRQRIIILGDAESFSMGEVSIRRRGISSENASLIMAMFNWLSEEELPIDTSRPLPIDNEVNLSLNAAGILSTVLKWILPGLLLALGALILIRRRGK